MDSTLSGVEAWSLLTVFTICVGIIASTFHGEGEPLIASLAFSGIAFAFTYSLIRWLGQTFLDANIKGRDMSKSKKVEMYVKAHPPTDPLNSAAKSSAVQRLWVLCVLSSIFLLSLYSYLSLFTKISWRPRLVEAIEKSKSKASKLKGAGFCTNSHTTEYVCVWS